MPHSWPLSARDVQQPKEVIHSKHHAVDRSDHAMAVPEKQQASASASPAEGEQALSSAPKPAIKSVAGLMLRLGHVTSAQIEAHLSPPLPASEESSPGSELDPEKAFLTPVRSNSPEPEPKLPLYINHNLAASHSSTDLCEDCSRNVETLVAANTLRNARLMRSSVDAMYDSYNRLMALHPEHDTEENRNRFEDLMKARVHEENGGTLSWETILKELKERGIVEDNVDEGLIMVRSGSSRSLGKKVKWPDDIKS